jgi:hypothetical protein
MYSNKFEVFFYANGELSLLDSWPPLQCYVSTSEMMVKTVRKCTLTQCFGLITSKMFQMLVQYLLRYLLSHQQYQPNQPIQTLDRPFTYLGNCLLLFSSHTHVSTSSLSKQLEYLSLAAWLGFFLYHDAGQNFFPTVLCSDIVIMIKNVFFCIAKA